jgi:hypothetical protein
VPNQLQQMIVAAGIDQTTSPWEISMLMHFCYNMLPATKPMLPKLLALLQCCFESGQKSKLWYILVQENIQNHYRTEGTCLFYGDAKKILSGELDYS